MRTRETFFDKRFAKVWQKMLSFESFSMVGKIKTFCQIFLHLSNLCVIRRVVSSRRDHHHSQLSRPSQVIHTEKEDKDGGQKLPRNKKETNMRKRWDIFKSHDLSDK